ncbi:MAG: S-layer-like protein array protein [Candidatus Jorgensenbacteria bacterium GW2011_GWA1_48_13]|uniref:S-layer-like protein array protein n=1 Tax=Candidatus Jorgensenbacteria bacterium GW2011_GWB1_50_10 TaxID=1618665 RepID=A0A0G1YIK3_9BACT|nr:MAG: S-layer-like protein array protein [Candidatus Jorgensenbacteria bacterium GW2011_GWA1_48_13]KKW14827.1 MAG: S-layer-like protein array protein [Candidatus Jorgensenbacteria bacterium GW2011_GWB1_50_10]
MFKKLVFCFLILVLAFLGQAKVFAYHPDTTHAALTDEIVDFYNYLYPNNQITSEEKEWIVQGSINEDYTVRAINHLYDPVRKISWNEEHFGNEAIAQIAQSVVIAPEKQTTAIDWINNRLLQSRYESYGGDRTWKAATEYWADGNKKEAYITLGHAVHLLEDMSVPDHTRNDAHPSVIGKDFGSPYEDYTRKWNRNNIGGGGFLEKLKREGAKPPQFNSIEEYLESMAQFSNNYFFSKDTISDKRYEFPRITRDDGYFGYGTDETGKEFPLLKITLDTEGKKFKKEYSLAGEEDYYPILDAYFSRLAPKTILYGAGVIELFQRKAAEQVEFSEITSLTKGLIQVEKGNFVDKFLRLVGGSFSPLGELSKLKNTFVGLIDAAANLPDIFSRSKKAEVIDLTDELQNQIEEVPVVEEAAVVKAPEPTPAEIKNQQDDEFDRLSELALEENKSDKSDRTDKTNRTNTALSISSGGVSSGGGGGASNNSSGAEPQFFPIIINEIMYDLPGADTDREWIEIFNNGTTTVDLSSWKFFESNTNHSLALVRGSVNLPPGGYAVIAASTTKFLLEDNPTYSGTLLDSSFSLSNSGETIVIKNDTLLIDEVTYSSNTGANGDGDSLQLINGSWQAAEPTPGEENEISPIGPISPISPTASFSYSPQNPEPDETVIFNAASSTSASGTIVTYSWNFGDAVTASISQATTTHNYSNAGTYIVSLTILDNTSASSTATTTLLISSPPVAATSTEHVVISEIMPGLVSGSSTVEWVELYNPMAQTISLADWSLKRKTSLTSTTTYNLVASASSTSSIAPKSFFLIASREYNGGKNPDLPYSQVSNHLAQDNDVVILYDSAGNVVDEVHYESIDFGKSTELKAWADGNCISAQGNGEFLGNGCDTDSDADFEIRANPNPQNSASLPEPREAPTAIATFTVLYHFSAPTLVINWSSSTDYSGATSTIQYEIQELNAPTSSTPFNFNSTSTALEQVIDEVGRVYDFSIKAVDADGLSSASTLASTTVPSFMNNLYFYRDPRASSTNYFIELYYGQYPFVPQVYNSGDSWRMVTFYLNKEAEKVTPITNPRHAQDPNYFIDGMIPFRFKRCSGSVQGPDGYAVVLPDTMNQCEPTGPKNGDLSYDLLEDTHLLLQLASSTSDVSFSSSTDYITAAYYDYSTLEGFKLVAADKTKYYFQDSAPIHQLPAPPANLSVESYTVNAPSSTVQISWSPSFDADSLDNTISYEMSFDSTDWRLLTLVPGADSSKNYANLSLGLGSTYSVYLRAVDDFNTTSAEATTTIVLLAPIINNTPDLSNNYFAVDEAKFENNLLKIKWRLISGPTPAGMFGIIPYLTEAGVPMDIDNLRALHRDYDGNQTYPNTTANSSSQCNAAITPIGDYTLGWQYQTNFSSISGQAVSDSMVGEELQFNLYTASPCGLSASNPPFFSGLPVIISN